MTMDKTGRRTMRKMTLLTIGGIVAVFGRVWRYAI
jgi:hypothetical protein